MPRWKRKVFLERRSNQGDKRTCRLFPTQKALLVNETIQALCTQWQERLLAGFDEQQKAQFLQMLERAAKNAVDGCDAGQGEHGIIFSSEQSTKQKDKRGFYHAGKYGEPFRGRKTIENY